MEGLAAMSKNELWFGYLKAGEKSTPVVRDESLETKSKGTVYLYNHSKDAILEYSRDIVEPKLVELDEQIIAVKDLSNAFKEARKRFLSTTTIRRWEREIPDRAPVAVRESEPEEDDFADSYDSDFDDDDLDS